MADSSYDMKKKLLDLKSEMLKNSPQIMSTTSTSDIALCATDSHQNELLEILKEMNSNQQKILDVLAEINSKIGGI